MAHRCSATIALLLPFVAACDVQPPGELVGEYSISGALMENTCGTEALPAEDPLEFQVQIRDNGQNALWLLTPPARSGTLAADGAFEFEVESLFPVNPNARQPAPDIFMVDPEVFVDDSYIQMLEAQGTAADRCTLIIVERMSGTLMRDLNGVVGDGQPAEDSDSETDIDPNVDLWGSNEIEIRASSGSQCDLVLQAQGGPFAELPCHATYDIEGQLLDPE